MHAQPNVIQPGRMLPPPPHAHSRGLAPPNVLVPNHPPPGATNLSHTAGQNTPHHSARSNSGPDEDDDRLHLSRGH